MKCKRKRRVI